MRIYKNYINIFVVLALLFLSCSKVPLTGRRQLDFIPSSTMLSMSFQQYDEFLKTNKLSNNQQQTETVKSVGQKIQHAVERYMADNKMSQRLNGYNWEFNLVESPEVNAWCMPGGKVVVYTGILPITQNEGGLAVVMGHEIAHAIANHGGERMSQGLLTELGGVALNVALKEVILPYSRLHENEADHLGLIFMAMAGYDPNIAVGFWERMAKQGGAKPPEFLSTHPSDQTRINKIKAEIPEAMKYYKK